jgi:hypothetical protein
MVKKSGPSKGMITGIILIVSILAIFLSMKFAFFSPSNQAKEKVDEFYGYEADGDFANSWNLFHSLMKEKFSKGNYIQDRAHVFMNHFGVETFTYTIGKPEEVKKWKMSNAGPLLKNVYKVLVTQTYKGKYGNFDLKQEVFVAKEKGEWRIMWDYNQ